MKEDLMKKSTNNLKQVAISDDQMIFEAPMIVTEISQGCLFSGFFGRLDSARIQSVTNLFIDAIENTQARYVIVDLSNVDLIDSFVAAHFSSILKTLHLIGVEAIVCGINPLTAQTMVAGGIELPTNKVTRDLKSALKEYYKIINMELTTLN